MLRLIPMLDGGVEKRTGGAVYRDEGVIVGGQNRGNSRVD